jgi:hypothetical protein
MAGVAEADVLVVIYNDHVDQYFYDAGPPSALAWRAI